MSGNLENPDMHPSQFQNNAINNVSNNIKETRTLVSLTNERKNVFGLNNDQGQDNSQIVDISKLESPGTYAFTSDDNQLSGSNTRFLFKNLYGETPLTFLFFSEDNIRNIQNLSKMLVYKQMNKVISDQNVTDLQIVMRSIFLAYSEHPKLIDETMSKDEISLLLKQYTQEVARLNELCVNIIVPKVCSQVQQYLKYLEDAGSPIKPIPRAISTSVAGTKQYRSVTSTLLGTPL
jgi:hypothetical protein